MALPFAFTHQWSVIAAAVCAYVYSSCGYEFYRLGGINGKAFIAELGTIVEEMKRFDYSERMIVSDIDVSRVQTERYINSSFKAAVSQLATEDFVEVAFKLERV